MFWFKLPQPFKCYFLIFCWCIWQTPCFGKGVYSAGTFIVENMSRARSAICHHKCPIYVDSVFVGWEVFCCVARVAKCFGYIAIPELQIVAILWDEVTQCKYSNLNKHVCHRWHPKFSKLACFLQLRVCCPLITIPKFKKRKDLPLLCGRVFS